MNLQFKTKAQNLLNLRKILEQEISHQSQKNSQNTKNKTDLEQKNLQNIFEVLPVLLFKVKDLKENENEILQKVAEFGKEKANNKVIIRSSSSSEDSLENSNAGAFSSISNVNSSDKSALFLALQKVANSMPSENDEILVQPSLLEIELCGVAFSRDKDCFAPYFCISFDESGSNDSITDGSARNAINYFEFRGEVSSERSEAVIESKNQDSFESKNEKYMPQIRTLIAAMWELERIFNCDFLDVEFAFIKNKKEPIILQVRPLIKANKPDLGNVLSEEALNRLAKSIESFNKQKMIQMLGEQAIFGLMPDWNPAEIIGTRAKRLAFSLYKEIIMDEIWAKSRDAYGYRNLIGHPLMHSFLGMPFVDVRASFNSFVPKSLNQNLAQKLINYYIQELKNNPQSHDKVEFDIVFASYTLDLPKRLKKLTKSGFSENETKRIEFALLELTKKIINPKNGLYLQDLEKISTIKSSLAEIENSKMALRAKIFWLLEICKNNGTLPFAGIARAAFVAMSLLNSLVEVNALSKEKKEEFLCSLSTINKRLSATLSAAIKSIKNEFGEKILKQKEVLNTPQIKEFLAEFGHLRAGSYNILSPRYDEDFFTYFDLSNSPQEQKSTDFSLNKSERERIAFELESHDLQISVDDLFSFMKTAIQGREEAKFEFSRLLSAAIKHIKELANYYEISQEDAAHWDIRAILSLYSNLYANSPKARLLANIEHNKKEYNLTCALKLPPLLYEERQIFSFFAPKICANFISSKIVRGAVCVIDSVQLDENLKGKIALIKSADPGYDYLFAKNIAALITCYGGANSHMAVRASELGLPAAIGVGEEEFNKFAQAKILQIDCASCVISVI